MKQVTLTTETKNALVSKFNKLSKAELVNPEALFSEVESKLEEQLERGESLSVEILGQFETKNGTPWVEFFSKSEFTVDEVEEDK